jgi:hypothetical protein
MNGTVARIEGLAGAKHLNGSLVTCELWDAEKGRWRVRLESGDEVAVKAENLLYGQALSPLAKELEVAQGPPKALAPTLSRTGNGNYDLAVFRQPQPQTWSQKIFGWIVPSWFQNKRSTPSPPTATNEEPPPKRRRVNSQVSVDSAAAETRAEGPGIKLQELRDIFEECDRKKAGVVTKIDLIKACASNTRIADFFELPTHIRQEDGTRTKFEDKWREIDTSGDREISWAELLAYYKHKVVDM